MCDIYENKRINNSSNVYKLGNCASIVPGGTPKTSVSEYWDGNIPWISVKDIAPVGRYIYETEKTITVKGLENSSTNLLDEGDIIISARGTVGLTSMIGRKMAFNQSCFGIKVKDGFDPAFVYYATKHSVNQLKQESTGSVFGSINSKQLSDLAINVPDLNNQKKISRILTCIDDKIELNRKINDNLLKGMRLFFAKMMSIEPFSLAKLSDIARITMGQSPPGESLSEDISGTLFYQGRAEFGAVFPTPRLYTTEPKRMAIKNSVLLSVRAPVGDINLALSNCCIGRGLAAIQSISGEQSFIHYLLDFLRPQFDVFNSDGTVFGSINKDSINNMEIKIPNDSCMKQFNLIASKVDAQIESNHLENLKLEMIRDYLLPKLISGEIDISSLADSQLNNHLSEVNEPKSQ